MLVSLRLAQTGTELAATDRAGTDRAGTDRVGREQSQPESSAARGSVAVQVEIDGVRTQVAVPRPRGASAVHTQRIPIAASTESGWGRVVLPADANAADNESFFVFAAPPPRRIVLISEDREASKALEIAASVSPDASATSEVELVVASQLDSIDLDGTALVLWCAELPDASASARIGEYVDRGGQVIFFPPATLWSGGGRGEDRDFRGIRWKRWVDKGEAEVVEHWRTDHDLLAATRSGVGLPVGQLEIRGRATLSGELTPLASLRGGDPLLGRRGSERGGVYFCTASPSPQRSSLADNGIVLYAIVQRAIDQGLRSLTQTSDQIAGQVDLPTAGWKRLAGNPDVLSTEYPSSAGVYRSGAGQGGRLIAVNRAPAEDQTDRVAEEQLAALFDGIPLTRMDAAADDSSAIAREIWRACLLAMIAAMLLEAWLCLPRPAAAVPTRPAAAHAGPIRRGGSA
ncbi:MAG: hypothetical protein ACF788_11700 [Novipirellula sp. JB048]